MTSKFCPVLCHAVLRIPGALPGREGPEREIFGMAGVPAGAKPGKPFGDGKQQHGKTRWVADAGTPGMHGVLDTTTPVLGWLLTAYC